MALWPMTAWIVTRSPPEAAGSDPWVWRWSCQRRYRWATSRKATARATLTPRELLVVGLRHRARHDLGGDDVRPPRVKPAVRDAPATLVPLAGCRIKIEPRGSDAALALPALVAELGLVVRLPAAWADDNRGARARC
jgi:hypothetical protein